MKNIMSLKNNMTKRLDKIEEWLNKNETKEQSTEEQQINMSSDNEPRNETTTLRIQIRMVEGLEKQQQSRNENQRDKRGTKKHNASQKNRRITKKRKKRSQFLLIEDF